jgi:X-X-X-Leu-X-X-Gly heptad repeat protein
MLQMTLTLPRSVFANVTAAGATLANGGDSRIATGMAMPGKTLLAVIEADVLSFELDAVSFNAVPLNFEIEAPDLSSLTAQLTTLTDAISTISAASTELSTGAAQYSSGTATMTDTFSQFIGSIDTFKTQLGTLAASSKEIKTALDSLNLALNPKLEDGTVAPIDPEDPLSAVRVGIDDLAKQYSTYNSGLQGHNTAFGLVAGAASGSGDSVQQLADAAASLADGASALSGGLSQLNEQTQLIPAAIATEIDGILASFTHEGFRPVSFTDARNGEVDSVQFIIRTDPIRVTPAEEAAEPEAEPSIWVRFLNLFR